MGSGGKVGGVGGEEAERCVGQGTILENIRVDDEREQ